MIFTINLMQDPDFPGAPYLGDLWRTVMVEKIDEPTTEEVLELAAPYIHDSFEGEAGLSVQGIPEASLRNYLAGVVLLIAALCCPWPMAVCM